METVDLIPAIASGDMPMEPFTHLPARMHRREQSVCSACGKYHWMQYRTAIKWYCFCSRKRPGDLDTRRAFLYQTVFVLGQARPNPHRMRTAPTPPLR